MRPEAAAKEEERLAARIQETGFSCTRCGECCSGPGQDSSLVMVSPPEIQRISEQCNLARDEIAEPYPENVVLPDGTTLTFGWALRRIRGNCIFYREGSCQIYACRPWICRTYPFMLNGEELVTSRCEGLGGYISPGDSLTLARDLIRRRNAEREEEEKIRSVFSRPLPAGKGRIVIDSEGVRVL